MQKRKRQAFSRVLHVANWYPNPWDSIEGNFVRDQIRVFGQEFPAETIVVQVRPSSGAWPRLTRRELESGARGYFLLAPIRPGKVMEWLSTLLLVGVLLCERAWRFEALHFHIAYPLLLHSRLWRWMFRRPILISEHWSAYHYNFHLPENSKALDVIRRPFRQGYPVFAVSEALLRDIRAFARTDTFAGFVIPNFVSLYGTSGARGDVPTFFAVNRWRSIKNPMPMLQGLNEAALRGYKFNLVIGGFGDMIKEMSAFIGNSALRECTAFPGKMTKPEIAAQLGRSDGYLFSSDYETFSVACAEALGSGVPLIGPHIPAIAEYAGPDDWVKVQSRDAAGWHAAIARFLDREQADGWDHDAIAYRATERFSETALRACYSAAIQCLALDHQA